jgi:hypothetical protein
VAWAYLYTKIPSPIGGDLDLVDDLVVITIHLAVIILQVLLLPDDGLLRGHVIELDAELEAEHLELLLRVCPSEGDEEAVPADAHRRHR